MNVDHFIMFLMNLSNLLSACNAVEFVCKTEFKVGSVVFGYVTLLLQSVYGRSSARDLILCKSRIVETCREITRSRQVESSPIGFAGKNEADKETCS